MDAMMWLWMHHVHGNDHHSLQPTSRADATKSSPEGKTSPHFPGKADQPINDKMMVMRSTPGEWASQQQGCSQPHQRISGMLG